MKKRSTFFAAPRTGLLGLAPVPRVRKSPESVKQKRKITNEDKYHFLELNQIPYISRDNPTMLLNLTKAVKNTYNSIQFPPEEEEIEQFLKEESTKAFITEFSFPLFYYMWFYQKLNL